MWNYFRSFAGLLHSLALTVGGPGLFFIALADSSFLSVPEANDLLIVVLSKGQSWGRMSYYVVMTILGSVAGCCMLYAVGRRGGAFVQRRLSPQRVKKTETLYRRWGLWTVLIPSVLPPPTPFKIFVLSAGLFQVSLSKFLLAVAVGRSIRYFMWGILAVIYGEAAQRYVEQNLETVGTILLILLVMIIVVYVSLKARKRSPQEGLA